jgi:hypothetical protein
MAGLNPRSIDAAGRRVALQLWACSVLCWWGLGIPFSRLWWLVNEKQLIEKPFELAELARVIGRLADSSVSAPESQPAAPHPPGSDRAPSG